MIKTLQSKGNEVTEGHADMYISINKLYCIFEIVLIQGYDIQLFGQVNPSNPSLRKRALKRDSGIDPSRS